MSDTGKWRFKERCVQYIIHCLYGQFTATSKNEWYPQENNGQTSQCSKLTGDCYHNLVKNKLQPLDKMYIISQLWFYFQQDAAPLFFWMVDLEMATMFSRSYSNGLIPVGSPEIYGVMIPSWEALQHVQPLPHQHYEVCTLTYGHIFKHVSNMCSSPNTDSS
jgi:hypothetical protein